MRCIYAFPFDIVIYKSLANPQHKQYKLNKVERRKLFFFNFKEFLHKLAHGGCQSAYAARGKCPKCTKKSSKKSNFRFFKVVFLIKENRFFYSRDFSALSPKRLFDFKVINHCLSHSLLRLHYTYT